MRARIQPGGAVQGVARVPGDKSISHRWVILAATARGRSRLRGLPRSLDVRSTARVMATLAPGGMEDLDGWEGRAAVEGPIGDRGTASLEDVVEIEGSGREALFQPSDALFCGNSGTTMRLVAGVVAGTPLRIVLTGDESLLRRPMERVAAPLRAMGARVDTAAGRPPITIEGGELSGVTWRSEVPSAQVKGAVLLAGLAADGRTEYQEPVPTRDHTERALEALGAPVGRAGGRIALSSYHHEGFAGDVPGDVSSAAFLLAAAILCGAELTVEVVGLNPTRCHFLEVLRRMGADIRVEVMHDVLGEPVGALKAVGPAALRGTVVGPRELPLVIDEVPVLAMVAAHAEGESRFEGAGELRVKESDRLAALAGGIRALGGGAVVEEDTLVVGGGGLAGGRVDPAGDHRLVMGFAVGALAARAPSQVEGVDWADVSYPGFMAELARLGALVEAG